MSLPFEQLYKAEVNVLVSKFVAAAKGDMVNLDLRALRRTYHDLCAAIRADPRTGLPTWALDLHPGDLLKRPLICIATENLEPALEFLDRHANVIGIVNDFKVGTLFGRHRCISTAEMIEHHQRYPDTVLVNSTVSENAQRYFARVAAQNDIRALSLLQFYRTLQLVDGIRVPIRPHGLLEVHDLLAFFEATLELEREYIRVEAGLDGDYSKITLYGLLLQRLTGDTSWHARVSVGNLLNTFGPNSYIFNSTFFGLSNSEVYVDVGAYRGDTVDLFARSVGDRFDKIHAFEPDAVNFAHLEELVLARFGIEHERVHCHQVGVWEKSGKLQMRTLDAEDHEHVASYFELRPDAIADAAYAIEVVALDEYLEGERVTLLKLEIEGSEVAALRGARQLILETRPKLALSAYHRAHDLIDLFNAVESLDAGYRIGLAHHKESVSASVYYCVPPP